MTVTFDINRIEVIEFVRGCMNTAKVRSMYMNEGLSASAIGKLLGHSKNSILKFLNSEGLVESRKNDRLQSYKDANVMGLYESGLSIGHISNETGLGHDGIRAYLSSVTKLRSTEEQHRLTQLRNREARFSELECLGVVELYSGSGLSVETISKSLGQPVNRIRDFLNHRGLMRSREEQNSLKIVVDEDMVLSLSGKDLTIPEIAESLGVSVTTARKWAEKTGIEYRTKSDVTRDRNKRFKRKISITRNDLNDLYHVKKMSLSQIGGLLGVSSTTVFNRMKELGIPTRTREEGTSLSWDCNDRRERHRKMANDGVIGVHLAADIGNNYSNTWIEREFEVFLQTNGIPHSREFQIKPGGHRYDFHITGTRILVETDGDYWHGTAEQAEKDEKFDHEAQELGFEVIRFREEEIIKSKGDCFVSIIPLILDSNEI